MQKSKSVLWSLSIFAVSVLLVLLWGGFNAEAYLVDDNRTQWFPVIERAYGDLFAHGKMPVYDFFQLKGLAIAEPGYYGIVNPVMMIAYMLSHFTPLPFSTITIHISIMFALGNVCFFWLCRTLGRKPLTALLLTASYSVISSFFSFSYWYYVFNNYLFVPLLLLVFLLSRNKKIEYFSCGIVLALEILCGNVQYTCYHYMIYGFICLIYIIFKKRHYIRIFLSNVICAAVLSAPFLLLTMNASAGFDTDDFHSMPIGILELLYGAFIPTGIIDRMGISGYPLKFQVMGRIDHTWIYNGGFAAILFVLLIGSLKKLFGAKKNTEPKAKMSFGARCVELVKQIWIKHGEMAASEDESGIFIIALVICLLFFISFISGGMVALILGKLPVIKQFRYLFKCMFVIGPLTAVFAAAVLGKADIKARKIAIAVCCVFTAAGMVNNGAVVRITRECFTDEASVSLAREKEYAEDIIKSDTGDLDTFRYMTLMHIDGPIFPETFHYYNGFLRNFPTTLGVYSVSGYEISAPQSHLEQFSSLYPSDELFTYMVNCGAADTLIEEIESDPEKVSKELVSNAIKYIFVQNKWEKSKFIFYTHDGWTNTSEYDSGVLKLNKSYNKLDEIDLSAMVAESIETLEGITVADIRPVNDYFDVIELDGVNGLCRDEASGALPLTDERMDLVSFEANGSPSYTLSFSYEDNLIAYSMDSAGNKQSLDISSTDDGNVVIHAPSDQSGSRIYLGYSDKLCTLGFVFEIVIVLAFLSMLIMLNTGKKKKEAAKEK